MRIKIMGPHRDPGAPRMGGGSPIPGLTEEAFAALAESIVVFLLHRPDERVRASQAIGWWARWGVSYSEIEDHFGGEISATRGAMAKAFLEIAASLPRLRFLVMIDADETINPLAPLHLALWDREIVSGVVPSPSEHGFVKASFTVADEFGTVRFPTVKFTGKLPARGLLEVNSVGAGLLAIRKDALERVIASGEIPFHIPESVRLESYESGTMKWGEDIAFCYQAKTLGIPVYVDFSVRARHFKTVAIEWPEALIDPELDASAWKVDPRDLHHG